MRRRKQRFINRKIQIFHKIIFSLSFITALVLGFFIYSKILNSSRIEDTYVEVSNKTKSETHKSEKKKEPEYINDTCFDGRSELPNDLYYFPFKKSDLYITNKKFVKNYEDWQIDLLLKRANEYVNTLYATPTQEIFSDFESYKKKLYNDITLNEEGIPDDMSNINNILKVLTENHVEMKVKFVTDKSLIYSDLFIYVRGQLNLKIFGCDNMDKLNQILPGTKIGKTKSYICDIQIEKSNDSDRFADYRIRQLVFVHDDSE